MNINYRPLHPIMFSGKSEEEPSEALKAIRARKAAKLDWEKEQAAAKIRDRQNRDESIALELRNIQKTKDFWKRNGGKAPI